MPSPHIYCVKCRGRTPNSHGHITRSNGGRIVAKARCGSCGTNKTQFTSAEQVGGGFWDDFAGGFKKGFNAVMEPGAKILSAIHPGAGAAASGASSLVNGIFGLFGKGVKGRRKKGRGMARTGAGMARTGAGASFWNPIVKAARSEYIPQIRPSNPLLGGRVGRGVLDDEISTDLHLKRR
jgi:hypothetical protein